MPTEGSDQPSHQNCAHFDPELTWRHSSCKQAAFHWCVLAVKVQRSRQVGVLEPASGHQSTYCTERGKHHASCELRRLSTVAVIRPARLLNWPKAGRVSSLADQSCCEEQKDGKQYCDFLACGLL